MTKVSLKILRGTGLVAADNNIVSEDSSDPYCQVFVGEKMILETPVQTQTLEPIWGGPKSMCEIDLDEMERQHICWVTIKIFDRDVLKSDDPLGMVAFHPGRVMTEIKTNGKYPNVWRDIEPLDGCEASGRLQFRLLKVKNNPSPHKKKHSLRQSALTSLTAGPKLKGMKGTKKKDLPELIESSTTPVTLHIYDVGKDTRVQKINAVTKVTAGGGIFHGAVEVHGVEYSFGGARENVTGIFACRPRKCPLHHYRESIFLGDCDLGPAQVRAIIERMKPEWMAPTYNLLRKNCCSFSKEFTIELGVGNVPSWLYKLADYGAAIEDYQKAREEAKEERLRQKELKAMGLSSTTSASSKTSSTKGSLKHEEEKSEKLDSSTQQQQQHPQDSLSYSLSQDGLEMLSKGESFDEGVEVSEMADSVIITPLDHVMVVRVQRAYRNSKLYSSSENFAYIEDSSGFD